MTRPPRFEIYALHHGANTTFDLLGATEHMDALVDAIFRRTGHIARPSLTIRNQIRASELQLRPSFLAGANARGANARDTNAIGANNASASCMNIVRALEGEADDVFDVFAARSTVDRALWKAATLRTAQAVLLPLEPTAPPAYQWVRHKPTSQQGPKERLAAAAVTSSGISQLPWWDVFRVVPFGSNANGTGEAGICRREPLNHTISSTAAATSVAVS